MCAVLRYMPIHVHCMELGLNLETRKHEENMHVLQHGPQHVSELLCLLPHMERFLNYSSDAEDEVCMNARKLLSCFACVCVYI